MTRAEWGAAEPVLPMQPQRPRRLTIHHTATRLDPARTLEDKLRGLQRFSQNPGRLASGREKPAWPDVPYHWYVDASGRVGEARDPRFAGDTNTTYDPSGHLLVVLEGNFEEEAPTPAQLETLERMTLWLTARWGIPADSIAAHRDFADTACPGDRLYERLPALRRTAAAAAGRAE